MLLLKKIILTHFKNYEIKQFDFNKKIVGIYGANGVGKTNLLDAIYYCCFTKSYFSGSDVLNIGFDKEGFRLEAFFEKEDRTFAVKCIHRGNKKEFFLNDVQYDKLSKHIGLFTVVMIAPDDTGLISNGSEERRKYLDILISQLDAEYLQQLMQYNKILQQRNSFLKAAAVEHTIDYSLWDILDMQLTIPAKYIFKKRSQICEELIPLILGFYQKLAGKSEAISCRYESNLHFNTMEDLLTTMRSRDRLLQRSSAGIHKDDLGFALNNHNFKNTASQGQRKTLLFALKLAEYELLKKNKGFAPLLLLDDVFEKLDHNRMHNLLQWVCNENTGNVFITDTQHERLTKAFNELNIHAQLIAL